jgi:hypothetical protein
MNRDDRQEPNTAVVVAGGRRGENDRKQNYLAYNEKKCYVHGCMR